MRVSKCHCVLFFFFKKKKDKICYLLADGRNVDKERGKNGLEVVYARRYIYEKFSL